MSGTYIESTALMSSVMPGFPVVDASTTTLADIYGGSSKGVKCPSTNPADYVLVYKNKPIPAKQYVWSFTDGGVHDLNLDVWTVKEWMERESTAVTAKSVTPKAVTPKAVAKSIKVKLPAENKRAREDIVVEATDGAKWFEQYNCNYRNMIHGVCMDVPDSFNMIVCLIPKVGERFRYMGYDVSASTKYSNFNFRGVLICLDSQEERDALHARVLQLFEKEHDTRRRNRLLGEVILAFNGGEEMAEEICDVNIEETSPTFAGGAAAEADFTPTRREEKRIKPDLDDDWFN